MGLAHVAAACDSTKAACINEDSGLLLGIVIAHEVGHVYCPCVSIIIMCAGCLWETRYIDMIFLHYSNQFTLF